MKIHHIALASRNPAELAQFYIKILGLKELRKREENGRVVSIWLDLEDSILMLEQSMDTQKDENPFEEKNPGFHLLALKISLNETEAWLSKLKANGIAVEHRSDFTIYFRDPEGNRIGLSHY